MASSRDISIFAKPASFRRTRTLPHPHLVRGSSLIRGEQMAAWLGCKLNPTSGYENDVCIHVKPPGLDRIRDGDWVDVMDGDPGAISGWLNGRPKVNVITFSKLTDEQFRRRVGNNMVLIPQHHCNFDREMRSRKEVSTAGFIGGEIGFDYSFDLMREMFGVIGLDFLVRCRYRTREDVVDFYRKIDIQVVWSHSSYRLQPKAPLKVVNAASFGIPTVALPPVCYWEVDGHYIGVDGIDGLLGELYKLKNHHYYGAWANRIVPWAEEYHISRIAELYRKL